MNQEELEKKVMEMLLAGDDPVLEALRNQYSNSTVESRNFTGAGFYSHFKVKKGIPPVADEKNYYIGDIGVSLNGINDPIGVLLFVTNGYLSTLEGYTIGIEVWPEYINVELKYLYPNGKRNLEELRNNWTGKRPNVKTQPWWKRIFPFAK